MEDAGGAAGVAGAGGVGGHDEDVRRWHAAYLAERVFVRVVHYVETDRPTNGTARAIRRALGQDPP